MGNSSSTDEIVSVDELPLPMVDMGDFSGMSVDMGGDSAGVSVDVGDSTGVSLDIGDSSGVSVDMGGDFAGVSVDMGGDSAGVSDDMGGNSSGVSVDMGGDSAGVSVDMGGDSTGVSVDMGGDSAGVSVDSAGVSVDMGDSTGVSVDMGGDSTGVSVDMGGDSAGVSIEDIPLPRVDSFKKVSILPLVFLIFYEVSGGPFGVEDTVRAAGTFLTLFGFLVFPIIWSVPEALITAEMGTMFPENGGYVVWVSAALGPYWGFQQGWVKWLSGVIDNALYPILFLDYLKLAIPIIGSGVPRILALIVLTIILTYMNYRGLSIVGWLAVILGICSLLPFVVMGIVAYPKLEPSRWLEVKHEVDWNLYLHTLFWNLNYWDSISTVIGEVNNPKKTLPKALICTLILVVLGYFFPILIGTGSVPINDELWTKGYFSEIAKILRGNSFRWWIHAAAAMSNMGMFLAEMSSDSFQLLGMAERGMLPEFFGKRSRHGTPMIGILISASGVLLLSLFSFQEIVAAENILYCFGTVLEFLSFIWLRVKHPNTSRPYKIPVGTVGAVLMCIPPTILICVVLAFSTSKVLFLSLYIIMVGLVMQPCLKYVEKKGWIKFSINSNLPDLSEILMPELSS